MEVPANRFKIQVIDTDLWKHDLIGEGECDVNETCKLGQAQVKVQMQQ